MVSTAESISATLGKLNLSNDAPIEASTGGKDAPDNLPPMTEMMLDEGPDAASVNIFGEVLEPGVDDIGIQTEEAPEAAGAAEEARQLRQQRLALNKAQRKAAQREKDARELREKASKYDQYQQVQNIALSDPRAYLEQQNVDRLAFGKKLIEQEMSSQLPVDPVKKQVEELITPYVQELEAQRHQLQAQQTMVQEANVMSAQVQPILQTNLDKYETLLAAHDNNEPGTPIQKATIQIYNIAKQRWLESGEQLTFQQVADYLEGHYEEIVNQSILKTKGLKKYSKLFQAEQAAETSMTKKNASQETKKPSAPKTLTNQMSVHTAPKPAQNTKPIKDFEPGDKGRIARTFAKLGLDPNGRKSR